MMKYLKSDVERLKTGAPVEVLQNKDDEIGSWSQKRIGSFLTKIISEADKIHEICGEQADTLICGPLIATILQTACPFFKGIDGEGFAGLINGQIKVYIVDEESIDPEELIIGRVTNTNSTTRILRYQGLRKSIQEKLPFELP